MINCRKKFMKFQKLLINMLLTWWFGWIFFLSKVFLLNMFQLWYYSMYMNTYSMYLFTYINLIHEPNHIGRTFYRYFWHVIGNFYSSTRIFTRLWHQTTSLLTELCKIKVCIGVHFTLSLKIVEAQKYQIPTQYGS